tara:strand:- start:1410 stop:1877 length:468 start_codon:yes stop_codon:yes gene_type:complete
MGFLIFFGALLFSSPPAFADGFIYLKCENQMRLTSTEIKTGKIINDGEVKEETVYLKIDPPGNRFMSYKTSTDKKDYTWDEASIAGGVLSSSIAQANEALEVNGEIDVEFQPAGKLKSKVLAIAFGIISTEIDITGDCVNVAGSIFEKALKEPEN